MNAVVLLLLNDLRRRLRSPLAVILMMLIPVVITLIIGLVFGRSAEMELPRIRVLLVDEDGGFFSGFIKQSLRQERFADVLDLVEVTRSEGYEQIEKGKASALIGIPAGFTAGVLDGEPVEIAVVKNPSETFLPVIVEEIVGTMSVLLSGGVRVFSGPISDARSLISGGSWPSGREIDVLLSKARTGMALAEGYVTDSLITFESRVVSTGEPRGGEVNVFAFILPGSLLIGLLFISEIVLRDIVREKGTGTLDRLLSAPLGAWDVIAGKILSTFIITAIACIALFAVSRFAFGIGLGKPLPFIVHFVGTIGMCTGVMVLFYGFIRSERAADAILSIAIIVMALLGGSMVPFEHMGRGLQRVGRFSPVFWASDGFKQLFVAGAGFREIRIHLVILFAIGVCTVIPGAFLLGRRIKRGG